MITIKVDTSEMDALLDPRNVRLSIRSALQKTAKGGRTVMSDGIRQRYMIKKMDLDKRIKVSYPPSADAKLEASVTAQGLDDANRKYSIPLVYFGGKYVSASGVTQIKKGVASTTLVKPRKRGKGKAEGAYWQVLTGKGQQRSSGKFVFVPGGGSTWQIARVLKNTKTGGPGKLQELRVITPASMAAHSGVMPKVKQRIEEQLTKEMSNQLAWRLEKKRQSDAP